MKICRYKGKEVCGVSRMDYKKATQIYKETNLATMSMSNYVLLLLKECLVMVRLYGESDVNEQNEHILKAQKIVFELMTITNRKSAEGNRLFTFYMHINQCLIEVRITKSEKYLKKVEEYLLEMINSWESTKPVIENRGYTRQDVKL